jgi:hypothetical protein
MPVADTQAYDNAATITAIKGFIVQLLEVRLKNFCHDKLWNLFVAARQFFLPLYNMCNQD